MKRFMFILLMALLFVFSAWCVDDSPVLPSMLAPVFGIILAYTMTGGFEGFARARTAFVIISVVYFAFALLNFGALTFSIGVLLFALSAALFFGRYDTMICPLCAIGAMSLFYSLSFAVSHIINHGLEGFPGMLSMRAVLYPLLAWTLVAALYGLLRMLASSGRTRFFTQEAFGHYFRISSKCLLVYLSSVIVLVFFLNLGQAPLIPNLVPFKTISAYFAQPGGAEPAVILSVLLLNAALFLPFGFLFACFKKKRLIVLTFFIAFFLSLGIEGGHLLPGKAAFDIDGVILHMAGFYAGMLLYGICSLLTRLLSLGRSRNVFAWEHTAMTAPRRKRTSAAASKRKAGAARPSEEENPWWEAYYTQ